MSDSDSDCLEYTHLLLGLSEGLSLLVSEVARRFRSVGQHVVSLVCEGACSLFVQLVGTLKRRRFNEVLSRALGLFLGPIVRACEQQDKQCRPVENLIVNARLWYAMTTFTIVCGQEWRRYKEACRTIAEISPPLSISDPTGSLLAEMGTGTIVDVEFGESLKSFLSQFVPSISSHVLAGASLKSVLRACAIAILESYRASSHSLTIEGLFRYLEEHGDEHWIDAIGEQVFGVWAESAASRLVDCSCLIEKDPSVPSVSQLKKQICSQFGCIVAR